MVEVWLPYGKTEVHVSVPLRYLSGTIEPVTLELPENPFEVITNSIENPIDSDGLLSSLSNRSKISIALDGSLLPFTATVAASSIVWFFEQGSGHRVKRVLRIKVNCLTRDGDDEKYHHRKDQLVRLEPPSPQQPCTIKNRENSHNVEKI